MEILLIFYFNYLVVLRDFCGKGTKNGPASPNRFTLFDIYGASTVDGPEAVLSRVISSTMVAGTSRSCTVTFQYRSASSTATTTAITTAARITRNRRLYCFSLLF